MSIAWYIIPYERYRPLVDDIPLRWCAINNYKKQIWAAGGKWYATEILGNRGIVKVKAPAAILTLLDSKYKRIPKNRLDDSLSDLSSGVKSWLRNEIHSAGYTLAQVQARFGGDLGEYTLGDVLRFMMSWRLKPRYDSQTDTIIMDGDVQECSPIEFADKKIT